jgi:hypothetical protein
MGINEDSERSCPHCGTRIYTNSPGQVREVQGSAHHNPGNDRCIGMLTAIIGAQAERIEELEKVLQESLSAINAKHPSAAIAVILHKALMRSASSH